MSEKLQAVLSDDMYEALRKQSTATQVEMGEIIRLLLIAHFAAQGVEVSNVRHGGRRKRNGDR